MIQTQYITLDDFKNYFGIDLIEELGNTEKAQAFIFRIEARMETFLDANFQKNIKCEFKCFTDYQKEHYKRALLEQAIYIFRNGDISVDSGYDQEKGVVADINTIKKISLAPNTKQELILCGLWNRNIRGKYNLSWWGVV